jgi:hypothetical protein
MTVTSTALQIADAHSDATEDTSTTEVAAMLMNSSSWLDREDFTSRFAITGSDGTPTGDINWKAAVTALDVGELPCGNREQRIFRLAAQHRCRNPGQPQRHLGRHR